MSTAYGHHVAHQRITASHYPDPRYYEMLRKPPTPDEITADAEHRHVSE